MNIRKPIILLAVFTAALLMGQVATAQERPDGGWYLRPRVGMSYYMGDNEKRIFDFVDYDLWKDKFPYNLGIEIGRRIGTTYQIGLAYAAYNVPGVNEFVNEVTPIPPAPNGRWAVQLVGRHIFGVGKIVPYVSGGLTAAGGRTWGWTPACERIGTTCERTRKISPGANLSVGVDYALKKSASLFLEVGSNFQTEIADIDGNQDNGFGPVDILGWVATGLNLNLQSFTPVLVGDLICPVGELTTGEPTTFTASVNPDATQPVTTSWNFGDGGTATGLSATHSYSRAGSYDVAFTATNGNGKGTSTRICAVSVKDSCVKADIVSMSASTMSPDTRTAVTFSANVRGTDPKQYHWDFGDGQMAMSASGSHTYSQAGTYTVKLVVTNCGGTVEKTMSITVAPYEAAICREITEMNPVFFARNSSVLTPEAREKLQENLAILKECPNLNARLEGWAAPGERMPQELSTDRAKAVEQFYVDNGIALSRLVTVGMGRAQGQTSKKEGAAGYQRVDTIPVRN